MMKNVKKIEVNNWPETLFFNFMHFGGS